MGKPWWQSTTIWGGIIFAVAKVIAPHLDPANGAATVEAVGQAIGAILAVVGARTAIARNGNGS